MLDDLDDSDDSDDFDLLDELDDEPEVFERFHDTRVSARAKTKQAQMAKVLAADDENVLFETTYKPSRHEAVWLYSSLRPFFEEQKLIDDPELGLDKFAEDGQLRSRNTPLPS